MAEPNKPKRTSAKSSKAKAASAPSKDKKIEDAVVVEDNAAETIKGAESPVKSEAVADKPKTEATAASADLAKDKVKDTKAETTSEAGKDPAKTSEAGNDKPSVKAAETASDKSKTAVKDEKQADVAVKDPAPADKKPTIAAAPIVAPAPEPQKRGGFFPMFLGGVIAACLGAGALYYVQTQGWLDLGGNSDELTAMIEKQAEQIGAQNTQIGTLETSLQAAMTRIDEIAAAEPDLTPVTSAIDALQTETSKTTTDLAAVSTSVAAIDPRLAELSQRINEVETQPIPKAEIPAEVTAAFERKLADMLASVDTRFGELETSQEAKVTGIETALDTKVTGIETTLNDKLAAIEAAQAAAVASEEELAQAASLAAARAAMAQIQSALDSGEAYADQLTIVADETGLAAPDALASFAADGVATLDQLKTSFPVVARDALAAATRDAAAGGDVSPLSAFFRTQLGARSLEPREGNDPDAVLSRAEAAVASADLDLALTEISALPQSGQDVLADWVASTQARSAAVDAAAALSAQIDTN